MKIHNFVQHGVSGVKNFNYMCFGFLCCVCSLISLGSWLVFVVFNLWIGPGFTFEPCS